MQHAQEKGEGRKHIADYRWAMFESECDQSDLRLVWMSCDTDDSASAAFLSLRP